MARLRTRKHKVVLNRSVGGDIGINVLLILMGAFMFLPMLYVIMQSLKPLDELWMFPPRFYVVSPTLKNFSDLFKLMSTSWVPFSRYIFNTVFISVVGTLGNLLFSSLAAYSLAKIKFPGRGWMFELIVLSLMFNSTVTGIANFITMSTLHWVDTYLAIIVPAWCTSLGLYLMKNFMDTAVSDAVLESARLDGATEFYTFLRIAMPMVKPAWLTLIIYSFQGLWNQGNLDLHLFRTAQDLQLRDQPDRRRRYRPCGRVRGCSGAHDGGADHRLRHLSVEHHRDDGFVGYEGLRGLQS